MDMGMKGLKCSQLEIIESAAKRNGGKGTYILFTTQKVRRSPGAAASRVRANISRLVVLRWLTLPRTLVWFLEPKGVKSVISGLKEKTDFTPFSEMGRMNASAMKGTATFGEPGGIMALLTMPRRSCAIAKTSASLSATAAPEAKAPSSGRVVVIEPATLPCQCTTALQWRRASGRPGARSSRSRSRI